MKENDNILIAQKNKINESELFKKYKSSYKSAFLDLSIHTLFLSCSFYLLWIFRNSWLSVFTIPLLALLNVKTFIIFHDCGHQSYTPSKTLNYIIGIIAGIITVTPFSWNFNHNTHHLTNGNYENIYNHPYNETILHSFQHYKNFSFPIKQLYKCLRHPCVFLYVVPFFKFLIIMRFNAVRLLRKKMSVKNYEHFIIIEQIINNIGIGCLFYLFYKYSIFYHYLVVANICSSFAIMLFHNQHTFNPPYVVNNESWNMKDSGLKGSSFIQIPYLLKYFTGNIEYHHIHHINAKIPNYNLKLYHDEVTSKSDMFDNLVKLSMSDCYNNLWLVFYDEDKNKYITFKEADEEIRKNKLK
jgi:acyl-lipid omega-6 desaturase (Delta-12 desaturase)